MAQTPRCPLDGGPYKPPLGVCAIYSQSIVEINAGTQEGVPSRFTSCESVFVGPGTTHNCLDHESCDSITRDGAAVSFTSKHDAIPALHALSNSSTSKVILFENLNPPRTQAINGPRDSCSSRTWYTARMGSLIRANSALASDTAIFDAGLSGLPNAVYPALKNPRSFSRSDPC